MFRIIAASYSTTSGTETAMLKAFVPTLERIAKEAPRLDRIAETKTLESRTTSTVHGITHDTMSQGPFPARLRLLTTDDRRPVVT